MHLPIRTAGCVWLLATAAYAAEAPHNYRDKNFDYFVSGDPARANTAHTEFGLALMGGGGEVDSAFRFLVARAGHGHIVILRASADAEFDPDGGYYNPDFRGKWGPVLSAETIVFHHREASSDPRVLAILRNADGIFLGGGDQANYIRYWKGTPVQDALNAHVRNKPIGGSSAGLAILGHYSYTALDGGSMESKRALADPFNSGMTLENDFLHCRWLEAVITDTHFSTRSRLGRLISFVARINDDDPKANVIGLGVDEKTAVLIGSDGIARVAPGSAGSAWVVRPQGEVGLTQGQPLSIDDLHLTRLDTDSRFDLGKRSVRHAGAEVVLTIRNGELARPSIASKMLKRDSAPPDES